MESKGSKKKGKGNAGLSTKKSGYISKSAADPIQSKLGDIRKFAQQKTKLPTKCDPNKSDHYAQEAIKEALNEKELKKQHREQTSKIPRFDLEQTLSVPLTTRSKKKKKILVKEEPEILATSKLKNVAVNLKNIHGNIHNFNINHQPSESAEANPKEIDIIDLSDTSDVDEDAAKSSPTESRKTAPINVTETATKMESIPIQFKPEKMDERDKDQISQLKDQIKDIREGIGAERDHWKEKFTVTAKRLQEKELNEKTLNVKIPNMIEEFTRCVKTKEAKIDNYEKERVTLISKIDFHQKELKEKISELEELKKTKDACEQACKTSKEQLSCQNQKLVNLEMKLNKEQSSSNELKENFRENQVTMEALEAKYERAEKNGKKLASDIISKTAKIEELKKTNDELGNLLLSRKDQIKSLKFDVKEMTLKVANLDSQIKMSDIKIENFEKDRDEANKKIEDLKEMQSNVSQLVQRLDTEKKVNEKQKNLVNKLKNEKSEEKTKHLASLSELRTQLENVEESNRSQVKDKDDEISSLQQFIVERNNEISKLKKVLLQKEEETSQLKSNQMKLNQTLNNVELSNMQKSEKLKHVIENVTNLEQSMKEYKRRSVKCLNIMQATEKYKKLAEQTKIRQNAQFRKEKPPKYCYKETQTTCNKIFAEKDTQTAIAQNESFSQTEAVKLISEESQTPSKSFDDKETLCYIVPDELQTKRKDTNSEEKGSGSGMDALENLEEQQPLMIAYSWPLVKVTKVNVSRKRKPLRFECEIPSKKKKLTISEDNINVYYNSPCLCDETLNRLFSMSRTVFPVPLIILSESQEQAFLMLTYIWPIVEYKVIGWKISLTFEFSKSPNLLVRDILPFKAQQDSEQDQSKIIPRMLTYNWPISVQRAQEPCCLRVQLNFEKSTLLNYLLSTELSICDNIMPTQPCESHPLAITFLWPLVPVTLQFGSSVPKPHLESNLSLQTRKRKLEREESGCPSKKLRLQCDLPLSAVESKPLTPVMVTYMWPITVVSEKPKWNVSLNFETLRTPCTLLDLLHPLLLVHDDSVSRSDQPQPLAISFLWPLVPFVRQPGSRRVSKLDIHFQSELTRKRKQSAEESCFPAKKPRLHCNKPTFPQVRKSEEKRLELTYNWPILLRNTPRTGRQAILRCVTREASMKEVNRKWNTSSYDRELDSKEFWISVNDSTTPPLRLTYNWPVVLYTGSSCQEHQVLIKVSGSQSVSALRSVVRKRRLEPTETESRKRSRSEFCSYVRPRFIVQNSSMEREVGRPLQPLALAYCWPVLPSTSQQVIPSSMVTTHNLLRPLPAIYYNQSDEAESVRICREIVQNLLEYHAHIQPIEEFVNWNPSRKRKRDESDETEAEEPSPKRRRLCPSQKSSVGLIMSHIVECILSKCF